MRAFHALNHDVKMRFKRGGRSRLPLVNQVGCATVCIAIRVPVLLGFRNVRKNESKKIQPSKKQPNDNGSMINPVRNIVGEQMEKSKLKIRKK